jgi:hypothetical protein
VSAVAVIENSEITSIYQSLSADQRRALVIYCVSEIDRRRGDDAEAVVRATMGVRRWKRVLKTIPQLMLDAGVDYLASNRVDETLGRARTMTRRYEGPRLTHGKVHYPGKAGHLNQATSPSTPIIKRGAVADSNGNFAGLIKPGAKLPTRRRSLQDRCSGRTLAKAPRRRRSPQRRKRNTRSCSRLRGLRSPRPGQRRRAQ